MFLIDTDPGLDDAHALAMAFRNVPAEELVVTTCFGNVGLDTTTENAQWLLGTMAPQVPIYQGCGEPLIGRAVHAAHIHGEDGLAGAPRDTSARSAVSPGHAAEKIVAMAREHGQDLTIVALGPLTNLAVALQLEPSLGSLVDRVVVMGGSPAGFGNASVNAEFNFYADPLAAEMVLQKIPNLTLVTWDVCLTNRFTAAEMKAFWSADNDAARMLAGIMDHRQSVDPDYAASSDFGRADPLAMAVALDPNCVTQTATHPIMVGYDNGLSHGASVVDWGNTISDRPLITLPLEFDRQRLLKLLTL